MKHVGAPLVGFEEISAATVLQASSTESRVEPRVRRFPIRNLRYWFMRHVLEKLHRGLNRPLRVLEVGIGDGNMLAFMGGPKIGADRYGLPMSIARWDGLSADADPETLRRFSYSNFRQANLDERFTLDDTSYDAIIVLHVLEHLKAPEMTMNCLLPGLRDQGLLMGGSPTMPGLLGTLCERRLRKKFAHQMDDIHVHKHISVLTPSRLRGFARTNRLAVDLLTGAFLIRSSNSPCEDHAWWIRFNLAWGALFPALGGEVYFALRANQSSL